MRRFTNAPQGSPVLYWDTVVLYKEAQFRIGIQYCSTKKPSSGQEYSSARKSCPVQDRDTVPVYMVTQFRAGILC